MNGQTLNRAEENNDLHRVVRLTYPWKILNGQIFETSLQAYDGKYNVTSIDRDFVDSRQAISLVWYPKPIGFQAEYNVGQGPQYNPNTDKVETRPLKGGYAQVSYHLMYGDDRLHPFVRFQTYDGARKLENAALVKTTEWEIGTEWQPYTAFELTGAYAISDRLYQNSVTNRSHQKGSLFRLQAQFNY
jgi:phosphate-selective porin